MKLFQGIVVGLALAILVLGIGLGIHKAYSSSPLAQKTEDIQLVEIISEIKENIRCQKKEN